MKISYNRVCLCLMAVLGLVGYFVFSRVDTVNEKIASYVKGYMNTMGHREEEDIRHCTIEERVHRLRATCGKKTPLEPYNLSLLNMDQMIVDDRRKYLYCAMPKAGSTTTKRLLVKLSGFKPRLGQKIPVHGNNIHRYSGLKTLNQYPRHKQLLILRKYFKIVVVRNPFDRLVSAHRDKFVKVKLSVSLIQLIKERFRSMAGDQKSPVTFRELITHFSDSFHESQNSHWMTYQSLCHPCIIQYDYVIKLETADEDYKYLIERLTAAPSNITIGAENKSAMRPLKLPSNLTEFSDIPIDIVKQVYSIFEKDFKMFGYNYSFPSHMSTCNTDGCC